MQSPHVSSEPIPCSLKASFVDAWTTEIVHWSKTPIPKVAWPKFKIMMGGDAYYNQIFKMLDQAKSHIFVISYTFDSSVVSLHVMEGLKQALSRGVKVYLFLENLIELPKAELLAEFKREGGVVIQRSKHKSFQAMLNKTFFQRDHEKLFVTDSQFVIGSANISEYYGEQRYGKPFFYDINLFGENCLSAEIAEFLETYIDPTKQQPGSKYSLLQTDLDEYVARFPSIPISYKEIGFYTTIIPFNISLQKKYLDSIAQAKHSIKILSAYYYPIRVFEDAIADARKRGVTVELITSYKRDIPAYKNFVNGILFQNLLKKGVKVYQFSERYLHAKAMAVDDRMVNLGSFNIDRWSWYNNIETVVHLEDFKKESQEYDRIFQSLKAKSQEIFPKKRYERTSKLIQNLFWNNFFLKSCDRLMNRAYFAFHAETENSFVVSMHRYLSWWPKPEVTTPPMQQANELIGKVPLNQIKHLVAKGT